MQNASNLVTFRHSQINHCRRYSPVLICSMLSPATPRIWLFPRLLSSVVYCFWVISALTFVSAQEPDAELKIVIVEGAGGTNNIRKGAGTARPVVEVRDRNDRPVAGAIVTFRLPQSGPGGNFISGGKIAAVTSDASGRASAAFQPVGSGKFDINVTAAHQGSKASMSIAQTNVAVAAAGLSGAAIGGIIAAVAGGAIIGVVCGTGKCGGGDSPSPVPPAPVPGLRIGSGGQPTVLAPPRP
jgi:hypothetical protein